VIVVSLLLSVARLSNLFDEVSVLHAPLPLNVDTKILAVANTEYSIRREGPISLEYESTIFAPDWILGAWNNPRAHEQLGGVSVS
jgi:hypothetical protein